MEYVQCPLLVLEYVLGVNKTACFKSNTAASYITILVICITKMRIVVDKYPIIIAVSSKIQLDAYIDGYILHRPYSFVQKSVVCFKSRSCFNFQCSALTVFAIFASYRTCQIVTSCWSFFTRATLCWRAARSLRQQRVCPSVWHTPVLCLAERKQDREMYTIS